MHISADPTSIPFLHFMFNCSTSVRISHVPTIILAIIITLPRVIVLILHWTAFPMKSGQYPPVYIIIILYLCILYNNILYFRSKSIPILYRCLYASAIIINCRRVSRPSVSVRGVIGYSPSLKTVTHPDTPFSVFRSKNTTTLWPFIVLKNPTRN